MKKTISIIILSFICVISYAQIKMHPSGQVSFQSISTTGGVQIDTSGITCFEPNVTESYTSLTQTKAPAKLVRAWDVVYTGFPPVAPATRFYVTGLGNAFATAHYTIGSGGGVEKGCQPIENASALLSALNGFYYDNNEFEGFKPDFIGNPNVAPEAVAGLMRDLAIDKSLGLSVVDLETVLPEAIRHDPEGAVYINYSAVIPVLVEAFKEQQRTIETLQKEITDLKAGDKGVSGIENRESSGNILYQNVPNPTNSSATIECYLDTYTSKATIAIYDLNGSQIKEYPLHHQGKNLVVIGAGEFKPGIYLYSLLVDGKLIDTKRMVITSK